MAAGLRLARRSVHSQPGAGCFEFTPQRLKRILHRLPSGEVDLGEQAIQALRAMGHGQLALMCLIARYGPAYAGADVPVPREVSIAVFRHILLLLAEPESFRSVLTAARDSPAGKLRGLDGLSAATPRSASKFPRLAVKELEDLCRLAAATKVRPVTVEEMKAELRAIARDDDAWDDVADLDTDGLLTALRELMGDEQWWLSTHDWPVAYVVPHLPDPDPALKAEMQRLRDQLDRRCRRAIRQEVADAAATAAPDVALDASFVLRREHATR